MECFNYTILNKISVRETIHPYNQGLGLLFWQLVVVCQERERVTDRVTFYEIDYPAVGRQISRETLEVNRDGGDITHDHLLQQWSEKCHLS